MNTTTFTLGLADTSPRMALGAVLGAFLTQMLAPALALALLAAAPAHAQLFKDDELYKRAAQLEAQRAADVKRAEQIEARAATQEARSEQQGRVLIDLTQQIDALKSEIAKLRGQIEVLRTTSRTRKNANAISTPTLMRACAKSSRRRRPRPARRPSRPPPRSRRPMRPA